MKRVFSITLASLFCLLLIGCGNSIEKHDEYSCGKPDMIETLDFRATLSFPITEVTILSAGREIHISDSDAINEAVDFICNFEFHLEENLDMDTPGAVSIIVRFFADSEMKELTFPYCLYNGNVYATDAECVLLFEEHFYKQQSNN